MKLGGEEKGNKMNEGGKKGVKGIWEELWEKDEQLQIVMLRKVVEEWAFIGYYHTDLLPEVFWPFMSTFIVLQAVRLKPNTFGPQLNA